MQEMVLLQALYCVEPPMARTRIEYTTPGMRPVITIPFVFG
jgi:hypothetical protein